jgi:hypothetical protein
MGIASSIAYGIVHDQITIRICPDYLLVWHPKLLSTNNLTLVALAWGVVATWWMGAFLGLIVGLGATAGRPPFAAKPAIFKAYIWVMAATGLCAALAGIVTWRLGLLAPSFIEGPEISGLSLDDRHRFMIAWVVHNTSYNIGAAAALVAAIAVAIGRYRSKERNG